MAHYNNNVLSALHNLRKAANAARDTGAHLDALEQEERYFPEIEEEALLHAIGLDRGEPAQEHKRLLWAVDTAKRCHFWQRIDDNSIRRVAAAATILIARIREQKLAREHAQFVRWCTNLQGSCNGFRRRLGRALEPFSREGFERMSLEELRDEHRRLLDAEVGLRGLLEAEQERAPRRSGNARPAARSLN